MRNSPSLLISTLTIAALLPATGHSQSADARARAIVSKMTLAEKVSQMHGTETKQNFRVVLGVPRLGIPNLYVTNGPAGLGPAGPGHQGRATALPAPISLAATWDTDAAREYGEIQGSESVDCGNTLLEAPDINIARVPQNGRTFEAYGEDPYLAGRLAVANIQAIQGQGIIANAKHYAANNQETNRSTVNELIDERTLREIYLPAFETAVKEGGVGSIMGAYNKVNGAFCCENEVLLERILKREWGFDGFVTSDFGAVHSTVETVNNGLDLEMPNGNYMSGLPAAAGTGKVAEAKIDEHLVRRFRTMMKTGVWDHLPERKPIPAAANGERARRLAEEGVVLLRNEGGLLPLNAAKLKRIALIGPEAMHAKTGGGGSSHVQPLYTVSPLEGLRKRLGPAAQVTLDDGKNLAAAVADAKQADAAIVMVGDQQNEGEDHSLALPAGDDALVEAIAAANPRTVVVLKTGGPALMPWVEKAPAILEAWYPGEEDGNAVAAVLMGDCDPGGRLPITFPKSETDTPAQTVEQFPGTGPAGNTVARYSEGVLVGYRWYDARNIAPLFPFGYGLSYTTFEFRNLRVSSARLSTAAPRLEVDFDIVNAGKRPGMETAQLYVGIPSIPGIDQPPRQLKGFKRVSLDASRTAHVHLTLNARAFSYWDIASHAWKVAPGEYTIALGASSRDIRLEKQVMIQ